VINLYLGNITPDALVAASANPDPKKQAEQRCEANFYLGEWHLVQGHASLARSLFVEAKKLCPRHLTEYGAANAELGR
jgi:rhomboid protease GluP